MGMLLISEQGGRGGLGIIHSIAILWAIWWQCNIKVFKHKQLTIDQTLYLVTELLWKWNNGSAIVDNDISECANAKLHVSSSNKCCVITNTSILANDF